MHHRTANPLGLKILPLTDCSPRINSQNPPNPKIPIDRKGGGGYTKFQSFRGFKVFKAGKVVAFETSKL